jgi:hypothetical protein
MEAVLPQPMNAAQLFVMETLATAHNNKEREELTSLYLNYVQQKLDASMDKWWKENNMTDEKLEEMMNFHYRTPYK